MNIQLQQFDRENYVKYYKYYKIKNINPFFCFIFNLSFNKLNLYLQIIILALLMGNSFPCTKTEELIDKKENDEYTENVEIIKKVIEEPILDIINYFTPKGMLKELKSFRKRYKIKKNLKCQKDLLYTIKVIENIRSERLFNAKIIKRREIIDIGLDAFKGFYETEMKVLNTFKHPNVESLTEVFYEQNSEDFIIIIISTFTTKNCLLDVINDKIKKQKKFDEEEISVIIKILIETIYKFKSGSIIHRNLTPESIFFQRESNILSLCIRNFYCSVILVDNYQTTKGITGPLWYIAPEILRDQNYDYKSDLWSLGLIFYMLLTLENPFLEANSKDQMLEILKSDKCFKTEQELKKLNISEMAISLLYKMIVIDHSNRVDVEILINDPFIKLKAVAIENNPFNSLICLDIKNTKILQFKIMNNPELHDLVFYLTYCLKDYFLDVDELFLLNEFYKYFDTNNDGIVEFEEIIMKLKFEKYREQDYLNYSTILKSILNCNFRIERTEEHLQESFDYAYFLTANIILNLYKNENNKTKEKIKIMFKELDEDGGGTLSLDEIQGNFTVKYNNDKNIEEIFEKIVGNRFYTKVEGRQIKNYSEMDEEDFSNLIGYEIVELNGGQQSLIKAIENRDIKALNDSNTKSIHTKSRSKNTNLK